MKLALFVMFSFALCGCQSAESRSYAKAEQIMRGASYDPDAAQFKNMRFARKNLICGEMNGKNRMGGYVGFQPFAVAVVGDEFIAIPKPVSAEDFPNWQAAVLLAKCDPSISQDFPILFNQLDSKMMAYELK